MATVIAGAPHFHQVPLNGQYVPGGDLAKEYYTPTNGTDGPVTHEVDGKSMPQQLYGSESHRGFIELP